MVNNYNSGRQLEYEIKRMFEDAGWTDSLRGAGSKGRIAGFDTDLVFSKPYVGKKGKKKVWLVLMQAKRVK